MHDPLAVTEIEGLEELKNVETNIEVREAGVQSAEIGVVDGFEDQARGLALIIPNDIQQRHDIRTPSEILKDLDLSLDLLLLHRLEHLDNAFLVVDYVDAFEHFGVLSST